MIMGLSEVSGAQCVETIWQSEMHVLLSKEVFIFLLVYGIACYVVVCTALCLLIIGLVTIFQDHQRVQFFLSIHADR